MKTDLIDLAQQHLYLYKSLLHGSYQPSYPQMNLEEADKAIAELSELADYVIELQELVLSAMGWWLHQEEGQYVIENEVSMVFPLVTSRSEIEALQQAVDLAKKIMKDGGLYDG